MHVRAVRGEYAIITPDAALARLHAEQTECVSVCVCVCVCVCGCLLVLWSHCVWVHSDADTRMHRYVDTLVLACICGVVRLA
jgi:hypothetical protein